MKLLVTGGAGFIGSAVIRRAISDGYQVMNVDKLTYAANLNNLEAVLDHPNYSFVQADICDQSKMLHIYQDFQPSAVMHLAAESHVDRSIDGPSSFLKTNVFGTFSLLQASLSYWENLSGQARDNFRFHHVSTDEVYGDLEVSDPAFTETTPYDPSSPYSASKAASDHFVRAWGRTYGVPAVMSNCSNNYGPYQFPEKLIPVVILKAIQGAPIPVYGDGMNIRDWLHVEDHVDALMTVLQNGKLGETYNIGGNNELTNIALVEMVCDILDNLLPDTNIPHHELITFVKDRPGHDRRYAVNASKIHQDLGWSPKMTGAEGFKQTVKWYLKNESWWRPLLESNGLGERLGLKR